MNIKHKVVQKTEKEITLDINALIPEEDDDGRIVIPIALAGLNPKPAKVSCECQPGESEVILPELMALDLSTPASSKCLPEGTVVLEVSGKKVLLSNPVNSDIDPGQHGITFNKVKADYPVAHLIVQAAIVGEDIAIEVKYKEGDGSLAEPSGATKPIAHKPIRVNTQGFLDRVGV